MSCDAWTELARIKARPLPPPLLEALGLSAGACLCLGDAATEFKQMPPLDMNKWSKAFASLGRCSVAVGLYMAGALKQLHYSQTATKLQRLTTGEVRLLGDLDAGYYHLLSDTFVVPHQFHCWWRLAHSRPGMATGGSGAAIASCPEEAALDMPPVQNLAIDGSGGMPCVEPPPARRPWLPHQCRSLRWMVYREAVKDLFVCESSTALSAGVDRLHLQWKMDKAFDLRGGVLCDPVGSGKTATVLGLVLHDVRVSEWACEVKDVVSDFFFILMAHSKCNSCALP